MADDNHAGEYRDEYTLQERRVRLAEQREGRFQRAQSRGGRNWGKSAASSVAGIYSGKGSLAALLLIGFVIVAIRFVADAEVSDDGTTMKAKVLHPQGEYGPVVISAGLLGSFLVLSLVAMGGGTRAKLAVLFGGCIVLTLGVKSYPEIVKVGTTFGSIGKLTAPSPSGQLNDIFGTPPATSASSGGSGNYVPSTGLTPSKGNPVPSGWTKNSDGTLVPQNGKCPTGWLLGDGKCYLEAP